VIALLTKAKEAIATEGAASRISPVARHH